MKTTRQEQIEEACLKYDSGSFSTKEGREKIKYFIKGAEWADANPLTVEAWIQLAKEWQKVSVRDTAKLAIALEALKKISQGSLFHVEHANEALAKIECGGK